MAVQIEIEMTVSALGASSLPKPASEGRAPIKVLELQPVADWDSKLFKLKTGKPHFQLCLGLQIYMAEFMHKRRALIFVFFSSQDGCFVSS